MIFFLPLPRRRQRPDLFGATSAGARWRRKPRPRRQKSRSAGARASAPPRDIVDELLADEGITQVDYVVTDYSSRVTDEAIASGQVDFSTDFSASHVLALDRGRKIAILAGVHVGCYELFAKDGINSIADLKGRSVGIPVLDSGNRLFLSAMAALVGLDPTKDINWVTSMDPKPSDLFLDGKVDAFLGFPPEPQHLRGAGRQSCDRQQRSRPAVVAVFLLHAGGQPGIRADEADRH